MLGKIFSPEVEIEGYKLFHKDRIGRRGGVALYVRDTLQCCVNNVNKTDDSVESICIGVKIKEAVEKTDFGVMYGPPNLSKVDYIPI